MKQRSDAPLASVSLLRRITDRHVLEHLVDHGPTTRAELAAATGISKPTVSESIRRLEADGVLAETAPVLDPGRSARRGPPGTGYALRDDIGVALALDGGPDGLVAEVTDVRRVVVRRLARPCPSPITAAVLTPLLRALVSDVVADLPGPVRSCTLSLAGPVEHDTGRLVHLPHSPFLVDELDARGVLGEVVGLLDAAIEVDNDVNWAALAEHAVGVATGADDFFYLHLGYGIGGAVVRDGRVVRGHAGLAGEPAHVITIGPEGAAMRLVECLAALDLLRPDSDQIDVARVRTVLEGGSSDDRRRRQDELVLAIAGVLASVGALVDPAAVVLGGPWAGASALLEQVRERSAGLLLRPIPVLGAQLGPEAPLLGARLTATAALRSDLLG